MKVRYLNQQERSDSMNGAVIAERATLAELLKSKRNQTPFVAELRGDNGFMLVFGIGLGLAFVEHTRINGDLPYLLAASPKRSLGGTPTPIPARNIISFDELKQIALYFLETGERNDVVSWEPV